MYPTQPPLPPPAADPAATLPAAPAATAVATATRAAAAIAAAATAAAQVAGSSAGSSGAEPVGKKQKVFKFIVQLYEAFRKTRGAYPTEDREPSSDQLSAIKQRHAGKVVPYVNFAIFGPHGERAWRPPRRLGSAAPLASGAAWVVAPGGAFPMPAVPGAAPASGTAALLSRRKSESRNCVRVLLLMGELMLIM